MAVQFWLWNKGEAKQYIQAETVWKNDRGKNVTEVENWKVVGKKKREREKKTVEMLSSGAVPSPITLACCSPLSRWRILTEAGCEAWGLCIVKGFRKPEESTPWDCPFMPPTVFFSSNTIICNHLFFSHLTYSSNILHPIGKNRMSGPPFVRFTLSKFLSTSAFAMANLHGCCGFVCHEKRKTPTVRES